MRVAHANSTPADGRCNYVIEVSEVNVVRISGLDEVLHGKRAEASAEGGEFHDPSPTRASSLGPMVASAGAFASATRGASGPWKAPSDAAIAGECSARARLPGIARARDCSLI